MELFAAETGVGDIPVVLLHGFGGSHSVWTEIRDLIGVARRVIAFDLPGHGGSLAHPHGSAAQAARAVLEALEQRGVARAHWVGHSMGGAAAAVAALATPERTASLTLLAPGGFGREVNHRLLRRYAAATEEGRAGAAPGAILRLGFHRAGGVRAARARERKAPGAPAALMRIVETFFEGYRQKTLATADLARLNAPVKVLWGTQDRVLPTRQAHKLPGKIAVHIFEHAGHMLPQEIPREAADLILENTR